MEIYDPLVSADAAFSQLKVSLVDQLKSEYYDAVIIAVGHKIFREMKVSNIKGCCKRLHLIYDLKYVLPKCESDLRL